MNLVSKKCLLYLDPQKMRQKIFFFGGKYVCDMYFLIHVVDEVFNTLKTYIKVNTYIKCILIQY